MLGEREMADDKVVEAQEGKEEHNHDQERDVSQVVPAVRNDFLFHILFS